MGRGKVLIKADLGLAAASDLVQLVPDIMKLLREEMRKARNSEISIPQHRIIANVLQGYTTSLELAEIQGVSLAAISKLADTLVRLGYIQKQFKSGNKKQIFFEVTSKGKSRYLKSKKAAQSCIAERLSSLGVDEKERLRGGLSILKQVFAVAFVVFSSLAQAEAFWTLEQVIRETLQSNPTLKASKEKINETDAQVFMYI
jgi:DNA-binding MarR family transcriptional regulator